MSISIDFVTDPYAAPTTYVDMLFFLQRLDMNPDGELK